MTTLFQILKRIVTVFFVTVLFCLPLAAQTERLDQLFDSLASADEQSWEQIETDIWAEWSRSGSAAMDLLLERGRAAMTAGNLGTAIEHLTALTDHAPEFAEGWNARATAYYQAGLYGPSIEDIRRTLALNPRHFGALSGLALILEELGHPEDALEIYRKVLAIHPFRPNLDVAIERLETEVAGIDI